MALSTTTECEFFAMVKRKSDFNIFYASIASYAPQVRARSSSKICLFFNSCNQFNISPLRTEDLTTDDFLVWTAKTIDSSHRICLADSLDLETQRPFIERNIFHEECRG